MSRYQKQNEIKSKTASSKSKINKRAISNNTENNTKISESKVSRQQESKINSKIKQTQPDQSKNNSPTAVSKVANC